MEVNRGFPLVLTLFLALCFLPPHAFANENSIAQMIEELSWETASDGEITKLMKLVGKSKSPLVFKAVLKKISIAQDRVAYLTTVLHKVNSNSGYAHNQILAPYIKKVFKKCLTTADQLDKDKLLIVLKELNFLGPNEYRAIFEIMGDDREGDAASPFKKQIQALCNTNGAARGEPRKIAWLVEKMKNDPWYFTEENFGLLKSLNSNALEAFCIKRIIQDRNKNLSYEDSLVLDYLKSIKAKLPEEFENVLKKRKQIRPKNTEQPFDAEF